MIGKNIRIDVGTIITFVIKESVWVDEGDAVRFLICKCVVILSRPAYIVKYVLIREDRLDMKDENLREEMKGAEEESGRNKIN